MEQGCQVVDVACGSDVPAAAGADMIDASCGPNSAAVVGAVDGGGVKDALHHSDDSLLLHDQFDRHAVQQLIYQHITGISHHICAVSDEFWS